VRWRKSGSVLGETGFGDLLGGGVVEGPELEFGDGDVDPAARTEAKGFVEEDERAVVLPNFSIGNFGVGQGGKGQQEHGCQQGVFLHCGCDCSVVANCQLLPEQLNYHSCNSPTTKTLAIDTRGYTVTI
jgi:hypothetical protein